MAAVNSRRTSTTSTHIMALDGIVTVNSLFTIAVFLGLSFNLSDPQTTLVYAADPACVADTSIAERLISFHVYSFSSFLFSSLLASSIKQAIKVSSAGDGERRNSPSEHVNRTALRSVLLASAAGSVSGCAFLTLALVDLVQIKLGTLACRNPYSFAAAGPLVILVPSALLAYVCIVLYAFTR
ncbi:uncharacterized protein LOC131147685 [Malania oleifera]|uniref:uncharacterized protein LOC131147685 n=1 Tax=Malania oleifera TaxID=397392 RepID=UPI0025AE83F2|nr:uncharacterized protein LOC131147685 [Malania oleifera]